MMPAIAPARRWISALCISASLAQAIAPALARADDNPFDKVPGSSRKKPGPVPSPSPQPIEVGAMCRPEPFQGQSRPSNPFELAGTQANSCQAPRASDKVDRGFVRLVEDYVYAYARKRARQQIETLTRIAAVVFESPGSQAYIDQLTYIDSLSTREPEAIYDLAKVLQKRWEAIYGMRLSQRLAAGIGDPNVLAEKQRQREENRGIGRRIGGVVALAALGVAAWRNPSAIPRYNALFRAIAPVAIIAGGIYLGGKGGDLYTWLDGGDLPLAPAHVMKLGIETSEYLQDDDALMESIVPILIGAGAGEVVYAAATGASMARTLVGVARGVRAVNAAATPIKVNPVALAASIAVTLVVTELIGNLAQRWEYSNVKDAVSQARDKVNRAIHDDDKVAAYYAADQLMTATLAFATYVNQPLLAANAKLIDGLAEAEKKFGDEPEKFDRQRDHLIARHLRESLQALQGMDQTIDADYESYIALEALGTQNFEVYRQLSRTARDRWDGYMDTFVQAIDGMGPTTAEQKRALFRKYLNGMRGAKDRELATGFRKGGYVRHAGHVLLQAGAMLRTTRLDYLRPQTDGLMSAVQQVNDMFQSIKAHANADIHDPGPVPEPRDHGGPGTGAGSRSPEYN